MTGTLISPWVNIKVLLMICLRIPPFARRQNLRNNLPLPPLLIRQLCDLSRNTLLLRIMVEDSRTVLRPCIWTLTVRGGRIMHLIEEFEELSVSNLARIICNLQSFGVYSEKVSTASILNRDRNYSRPVRPEQTAL